MSQQDHEVIRRMYSAWNTGDMDALTDVFDSEVEVRPALSTFLSSTVYRGHEGVLAWYSETYEPWVQMTAEPQRFVDVGERTVVVVALHARVSGGKVDLEGEIAQVATIRDGRIVKLDGYDEPAAALRAVGLEQ